MGLETFTYITSLNASNPVGATDPKSQGDDHLRGIKLALLNSFPSISGAVTADQNKINQTCVGTGGTFPAINGSALTSLNASNVASGTLADARLSANIPLLNAANIFSGGGTQAIVDATAAILRIGQGAAASDVSGRLLLKWDSVGATVDFNAFQNGSYKQLSIDGAALRLNHNSNGGITFGSSDVSWTDFARLSQTNSFTQNQTITNGSSPRLIIDDTAASNSVVRFSKSGTAQGFVGSSHATNGIITGDALGDLCARVETGGFVVGAAGAIWLKINSVGNFDFKGGTVTRNNASAAEVGNAGYPRRNVSASGSTNATDAHGAIVLTGVTAGQTFTLNANPPVDSVLLIVNESSQNWTIAASGTLTKDGATGSFTLAAGWMLWVFSDGSGNWRSTSAL